jgi:AraC family transcriptional regulator of adaptative response/methylated-DNA-[protein]-cysteine methyltransferase
MRSRVVDLPGKDEMYRALSKSDSTYDGIFLAAVKTTGIFCRPSCPARTPLRRNVEFFPSADFALSAGYRPCKRCRPLEPAGKAPAWLRSLLDKVEEDPAARLTDADLRSMKYDPVRVRRWFKKHHRMTFQAYLRARRLGMAIGRIRHGEAQTRTAFGHGYESLSGFREAFGRIFNITPGRSSGTVNIYINRILSPLGPMVAGATDEGLCLLEFDDRRMLETQLRTLKRRMDCTITPGRNEHLDRIDEELREYFNGTLREFSVDLVVPGTEFQQQVWSGLRRIPYGRTLSYEQLAGDIDRSGAVRAVGRANGDNRIAIVIPCHRVIGADGRLTGYGGGLWRKQYLLELERAHSSAEGIV